MAITPLPEAPSRSDPATFATKGDALLGALAQFVEEANALLAQCEENATTLLSLQDIRDDINPPMISLGTATASNSATIEFSLDATDYIGFKIILDSILPATNGEHLLMQVKQSGAWVTSLYTWKSVVYSSSAVAADGQNAAGSGILLTGDLAGGIGNTAQTGGGWVIDIFDTRHSNGVHRVSYKGSFFNNEVTAHLGVDGLGFPSSPSAITDIRFLMTSGNIASGSFNLYGIRN